MKVQRHYKVFRWDPAVEEWGRWGGKHRLLEEAQKSVAYGQNCAPNYKFRIVRFRRDVVEETD